MVIGYSVSADGNEFQKNHPVPMAIGAGLIF